MRVAAIIENTEVANVIMLADGSDGDDTLAYYADAGIVCVEITGMDPMPGIGLGWRYADGEWIAPPELSPAPVGE